MRFLVLGLLVGWWLDFIVVVLVGGLLVSVCSGASFACVFLFADLLLMLGLGLV